MEIDALNMEIERRFQETGSYIEAITDFAEENGVADIEDIVDELHAVIIEKVKAEFIERNYFPGIKNETSLGDFLDD